MQRKLLKCDQQRIYIERRKEKPRKPQFSLNFQFGFGEEEETRATNERFVWLHNGEDVCFANIVIVFLIGEVSVICTIRRI